MGNDRFTDFAQKIYRTVLCVKSRKHYKKLFQKNNIRYIRLTHEQRKMVKELWGGRGIYIKSLLYYTHELVLSATGDFRPEYMPEYWFMIVGELALNDQKMKYAWSDKSYFDYLHPDIKFPNTIVRNINGTFYNNKYDIISKEDALCIAENFKAVAIKPSVEGGFGKNVARYEKIDFKTMFNDYHKDYVIQEIIKQHQSIADLNPSSVNVVRYISIFINGQVYPVTASLRIGAQGAFNDNSVNSNGDGMVVIGITDGGKLKEVGYQSNGIKVSKCNNVVFAGMQIPGFEKMKEIITSTHQKMAHFGFVGWDFAIDETGEPIVMEYNIKGPGILYYQYVNGPLFAGYTHKVMEYVNSISI